MCQITEVVSRAFLFLLIVSLGAHQLKENISIGRKDAASEPFFFFILTKNIDKKEIRRFIRISIDRQA